MVRRIFHRIFSPIAFRLGYQRRAPAMLKGAGHKDYLLLDLYTCFDRAGFKPRHIVDVGANRGGWARVARKAFPDALITMLEPQEWLKSDFQDLLADGKTRFFPYGAGKKAGTFKFTIAERDDSCTFRLSEEEARASGLEQREIRVVTLSDLVKEQNLPIPDVVKIDAEGLDIDVLEGASSLLGQVEVFLVEAGVANKIFTNSVVDVVTYMDGKGYRLFAITDLNKPWTTVPVLWLVELAFVRKNGVLDNTNWLGL